MARLESMVFLKVTVSLRYVGFLAMLWLTPLDGFLRWIDSLLLNGLLFMLRLTHRFGFLEPCGSLFFFGLLQKIWPACGLWFSCAVNDSLERTGFLLMLTRSSASDFFIVSARLIHMVSLIPLSRFVTSVYPIYWLAQTFWYPFFMWLALRIWVFFHSLARSYQFGFLVSVGPLTVYGLL